MSNRSWKDVRSALRGQAAGRRMTDAASFWRQFQARARMVSQNELAPELPPLLPPWLKWAAGGVGALAAAAALLLVPLHAGPHANQVKRLEVFAAHSGIFIMTDASRKGTIVWISDMDSM